MGANHYFPLQGDRLRKSKWWRRASDAARARNVMLWWEAYKSVPAGSLPDDDDELAEAAGYGMDVESFLAHKAEILAPWTLCSDGRWYHPTVCEVVLATWERLSERRKAGAARQAAYRQKTRGDASSDDEKPDVTPNDGAGNASHHEGDASPVESNASPGDKKKREEKRGKDTDSSSGDDVGLFDLDPAAAPPRDPVETAFKAYNAMASEVGRPVAKALSDTRRKSLKARLREHGEDAWSRALEEVRRSDFLRGKSERWPAGADLDFLLQAKSFQRVIEGYYSRGQPGPRETFV